MAMQRSNPVRWLLVSAALAVAGPAMAQSASKEPLANSKQSSAKSSPAKPAAAPRRLDFVPDRSVKEASTGRATATGSEQSAPAPVRATQGSHCHSQDGDA
jgi:hypothetical protein